MIPLTSASGRHRDVGWIRMMWHDVNARRCRMQIELIELVELLNYGINRIN